MKIRFVVFILMGFVVASNADLAIDFSNNDVGVQNWPGGKFVPDGTMVQLIWSEAGIQTDPPRAYNVAGGRMLSGEVLLAQTVTERGFGFWGPLFGVYNNEDVGGLDVHAGFFFTRVFGSIDGNISDGFVDVNEVDARGWVYNLLDPLTVYRDGATGLSSGSILYVPEQIPEPSTYVLLGVFGVGIGCARRRFHR